MGKKKNVRVISKAKSKPRSLAEKTEQILLTMPKIIAAQIGKDFLAHKKEEIKLNLELKKFELQNKKLTEKILSLKRKNTPLANKQINASQKMLRKCQQQLKLLTRDRELLQKQLKTLAEKKAMYQAFQAQLHSFKKEWLKKMSNKAQAESKVKVVAKNKTKVKKLSDKKERSPVSNLPQESKMTEVLEIAAAQEETEFAQEPQELVSSL